MRLRQRDSGVQPGARFLPSADSYENAVAGQNPPVLRRAPFDKGGHRGFIDVATNALRLIFIRQCCTEWYMKYCMQLIVEPVCHLEPVRYLRANSVRDLAFSATEKEKFLGGVYPEPRGRALK